MASTMTRALYEHHVQLVLGAERQVCRARPWTDALFMCLHTTLFGPT